MTHSEKGPLLGGRSPMLVAVLSLGLAWTAGCGDDGGSAGGGLDATVLDTNADGGLDGPSPGEVGADGVVDGPDAGVDAAGELGDDVPSDSPDETDLGRPTIPPDTLGGDRPAVVYAPNDYAERGDWPLVIVLHGYGATGSLQNLYFGLSNRVSRFGFVLLVPEGTTDVTGSQFWNFGPLPGGVDDFGYLAGLIDEAVERLRVDPERVYLIGHSNGAFMAYAMACEHAERVTAIAGLAGASLDPTECDPAQPVSVLHMHGTLDATVPYGGGSILGYTFPGAEDSVDQWVGYDGCDGEGIEGDAVDYETTLLGDETTPTHWEGCDEGARVELWSIAGASHIPNVNDEYRNALVEWLLARRREP